MHSKDKKLFIDIILKTKKENLSFNRLILINKDYKQYKIQIFFT